MPRVGWAGVSCRLGGKEQQGSLEPAPADSRNCFHLAFPYCSSFSSLTLQKNNCNIAGLGVHFLWPL